MPAGYAFAVVPLIRPMTRSSAFMNVAAGAEMNSGLCTAAYGRFSGFGSCAADLVDPQDRQEGTARHAAGEKRSHDARRFPIGVRLPGVHGGQTHLGAVADEEKYKGRVQPLRGQLRGDLDELVKEQCRF